MPVLVMGISTFPIEMIACEDENKEKSTFFTSDVDSETSDDGFFKRPFVAVQFLQIIFRDSQPKLKSLLLCFLFLEKTP